MRTLLIACSVTFCLGACRGQLNNDSLLNNEAIELFPADSFGMPNQVPVCDTSPAWELPAQRLQVTGIIYKPDGRTPAPGVVLYYYHTDTGGRYVHQPDHPRSMPPNRIGQTHGYIRGWVRTDSNGHYSILTIRPGVYPQRDAPAHIHFTIQDPVWSRSYYIDDLVFDDDPLLTGAQRRKLENRAGSGVARTWKENGLEIAERNIVLGLNIPGYPHAAVGLQSGPAIGEDQPSFSPFHAWGPDRGTRACPVCKYGRYHGCILFVSYRSDWTAIRRWLLFLEDESKRRMGQLKVYFVYSSNGNGQPKDVMNKLENLGKELGLRYTALTWVPSFSDEESDVHLCRINPDIGNTLVLYRNRTVIDKWMDPPPTEDTFRRVRQKLDSTRRAYFDLPGSMEH